MVRMELPLTFKRDPRFGTYCCAAVWRGVQFARQFVFPVRLSRRYDIAPTTKSTSPTTGCSNSGCASVRYGTQKEWRKIRVPGIAVPARVPTVDNVAAQRQPPLFRLTRYAHKPARHFDVPIARKLTGITCPRDLKFPPCSQRSGPIATIGAIQPFVSRPT